MKYKPPRGTILRHRRYIWLFFVVPVAVGIIVWASVPSLRKSELVVAYVALVLGVVYFFLQQHLEQARFLKELVTEFNRRYDAQNNDLLKILESTEPLVTTQKQLLIDYFNLCAEEYLFYTAGYIYKRVWDAWENGMRQFGQDPRVAKVWQQEIKTDSYYGFEFPISDDQTPVVTGQ